MLAIFFAVVLDTHSYWFDLHENQSSTCHEVSCKVHLETTLNCWPYMDFQLYLPNTSEEGCWGELPLLHRVTKMTARAHHCRVALRWRVTRWAAQISSLRGLWVLCAIDLVNILYHHIGRKEESPFPSYDTPLWTQEHFAEFIPQDCFLRSWLAKICGGR